MFLEGGGASFSLVYMLTLPDATFTQMFQEGGRIQEVVITLRLKTISRWSQRLRQGFRARPIHSHRYPHCATSENRIMYKWEVETVTQTGSTNNLTTKTDINAISVAVPMFWGQVFHWFICQPHLTLSFTQKFQEGGRIPEVVIPLRRKTISRWS